MKKLEMSQSVIYFALCVLALMRCGSGCSFFASSRKTCPLPKSNLVPEYAPAIAGGKFVSRNDDPIPYQLSLRRLQNPPENCQWDHVCGAVILDEYTAVTAAHCFHQTRNESRYLVFAGENLLDTPKEANEQVLQIQKIVIHPDYKTTLNGSDIAILHVDKFQFNRYAQPALISRLRTATLSNRGAVISGWGYYSDQYEISNSLRKGTLLIEPPENCTSRLEHKMKVPVRRGIVCAVDRATRICKGDSGGPLVIQNYTLVDSTSRGNLLVGITSFAAISCSGEYRAAAFTEISYFYDWILQNKNPKSIPSCSVAMEMLPSPRSKTHTIHPHGNNRSFEVLCDFETDGGGWTLIQKRTSGPKKEFHKYWNEYANGFGSLDGNFWLGLENIHALTKNGDQELRIELEDFEGEKRWAKYSSFSISDASDFYKLIIGGFYGNSTAGDSMSRSGGGNHNAMRFTTTDKDNDNWSYNCADYRGGGGWWFNACGLSNLNGRYYEKGETVPAYTGIYWYSYKGEFSSLAKSEMKIRTRKSK